MNCCAFKVKIYMYQGNTKNQPASPFKNQFKINKTFKINHFAEQTREVQGHILHAHPRQRRYTPTTHIREFPPTTEMQELQQVVSKPQNHLKVRSDQISHPFPPPVERGSNRHPTPASRVTAANCHQPVCN